MPFDSVLEMRHPGRRIVTGKPIEPNLSSACKGWRGIMLESFPSGDADFTATFQNHCVTLFSKGSMFLCQKFEGRVSHDKVRQGHVILGPAGALKTFQHKAGAEFIVVHVAPSLVTQIYQEFGRSQSGDPELIHQFCTRDAHIESLVLQLWSEYHTADMASGIYAETLGVQLAIHLLRNYSNRTNVSLPSSSKLSPKTLQRAIDYIDANLDQDLTITDVAKALSMSLSHFAHSFKNTTGIAPHHYIIKRKIERAELLLRTSNLSVSHVAMDCGFSTPNYFSSTFRRLTGKIPSALRRKA